MRVDDATQRRELVVGQERGELVAGAQERQLVVGQERGKEQRELVAGQEREELRLDRREANSRSWRGRTEGQSTPDTEQRGEETR